MVSTACGSSLRRWIRWNIMRRLPCKFLQILKIVFHESCFDTGMPGIQVSLPSLRQRARCAFGFSYELDQTCRIEEVLNEKQFGQVTFKSQQPAT